MRTEEEIFVELQNLCTSRGYIHAIAYFCFRDTTINVGRMIDNNSINRLIRNEISTLIGLMMKREINDELPSSYILEEYITKTETFLEELHEVLLPTLILKKNNSEQPPSNRGKMFREAIFYGPESAYTFQYQNMALIKYESDKKWLQGNKGFTIQEASEVYLAIEKIQNRTLNGLWHTSPELWNFLDIFTFSIKDIAQVSNISESTISAVLSAFTQIEMNEGFCSLQDFNSTNAAPILQISSNNFLLFQIRSLAESIYESPFYWFCKDEIYKNIADKHRGSFTEIFCRDRLELVFGKKNVFQNISIFDPKGIEVGEIDVLVMFGNRAIILQAKSKRLTLEAKKGHDGSIQADFKVSVQKAYDQGLLCAKRLTDLKFTKQDTASQIITVSNELKEIYILCVVADHYPSLNFQAREFLKYETTEKIQPPMVLDVFAIDTITEMLQSPLYFLSYINRRVNYFNEIIANNEHTILAFHLRRNLWITNESVIALSDEIAADLDHAMRVRRLGINGKRTPDGILTRINTTVLGHLIKQIETRNDPTEIDLGFTLLTLGEDTIRNTSKKIKRFIKLKKKNNKTRFLTLIIGQNIGLTIYCGNHSDKLAKTNLQRLCEKRKYLNKATKWYGICISFNDLSLRFSLTLDFKWEQSAIMENFTHGMTELSQNTNRVSPKRGPKIGRNDLCPCGSGQKFKKCCLARQRI